MICYRYAATLGWSVTDVIYVWAALRETVRRWQLMDAIDNLICPIHSQRRKHKQKLLPMYAVADRHWHWVTHRLPVRKSAFSAILFIIPLFTTERTPCSPPMVILSLRLLYYLRWCALPSSRNERIFLRLRTDKTQGAQVLHGYRLVKRGEVSKNLSAW